MKIGIQTGSMIDLLGYEKGYAAIKESGFEGIDWNLVRPYSKESLMDGSYTARNIFDRSLDEIVEHYAEELAVIRKNGLSILQIHAPFPPRLYGHIDILDCVEVYQKLIAYCDYIECPYIVMHPIKKNFSNPARTEEQIEKENNELFAALIPSLLNCKNRVTICLENLILSAPGKEHPFRYEDGFCGDPKQAPGIIDRYNRLAGETVFGLCLDTGHVNLMGRKPSDYIIPAGNRLKTLNLQDNDWDGDWHLPPCSGLVEWNALCDLLKTMDYQGDLVAECAAYIDKAFAFSEEVGKLCLQTVADTEKVLRKKIREG